MQGFGGSSHHSHHHSHSKGHDSPTKTSGGVFFDAQPNVLYKILSVLDGLKCFTVKKDGNRALTIEDYKGLDNQTFHIYNENGKYALVSTFGSAALRIDKEDVNDRALIVADSGKYPSCFF